MDDWRRDEATNQSRFRDMNESIVAMNDALDVHEEMELLVCECGDGECEAPISLTRAEYESVRADPTYFAIAIDHENPEIDRLVSEHGRYAIVQKAAPAAVRIARETDPRQYRWEPQLPQPSIRPS